MRNTIFVAAMFVFALVANGQEGAQAEAKKASSIVIISKGKEPEMFKKRIVVHCDRYESGGTEFFIWFKIDAAKDASDPEKLLARFLGAPSADISARATAREHDKAPLDISIPIAFELSEDKKSLCVNLIIPTEFDQNARISFYVARGEPDANKPTRYILDLTSYLNTKEG